MKHARSLRWSCSIVLIGCHLAQPNAAWASTEVEFNEVFLRSPVDIRMFSKGNPVEAGEHRIDVQVNEGWKGRYRVTFELVNPDDTVAQPCYDLKLLESLGFDLGLIDADTRLALHDKPLCVPLNAIMAGTTANFDSEEQRLNIVAPQLVLQRHARGYVSPELWDDGITASVLQYDYLAYHTRNSGAFAAVSDTSHYLGLRAGLNVGKWRLRYRASVNASSLAGSSYQGLSAYAERGLVPWRSRLVIGDATTDGQVFDSLSFRGIQISSDDRMYADTQRGFAPLVQGIANSNARVRITQQGSLIYETTVPPGPFVIDDLYPTGVGGDLRVTVTEADGSEHAFTVTYASIAELLRPGVTRYSLMAGQYRNRLVDDKPAMVMGTLRHGFSNLLTGYTGVIGADGYQAVSLGLGLNTSLGAIAMDVTHARSDIGQGQTQQGQSVRLAYSKILPVVDTNVTLATYRYSSSGYFDANEAFILRDQRERSGPRYDYAYEGRRHRLQLSATQSLPDGWGMFSLNASRQDYWRKRGVDTEFQFQYNNRFKRVNYSISAGRSRNVASGRWDNQVMLMLSVPLGASSRSPQLNTSYSRNRDSSTLQSSLSGVLGSDNQFGYSAFASSADHRNGPRNNMVGASASWSAPFANMGASVSSGSGFQQYSASISGGVVAYSGGVVFSPALGETSALVEAKGAGGARVANYSGVRLDSQGRAVVPYLNPYRQNVVEIDPKGLSTDVELKETSRRLAPTAGAIALLRFETDIGYSVLMKTLDEAGQPLPFGAEITDEQGRSLGYMAQAGQTLLRLPAKKGKVRITWGADPGQSCLAAYDLDDAGQPQAAGYRELGNTCINRGGK